MSGIWKFFAVSGIFFWAGIGACLLVLVTQAIGEAISRRHKERSDKRWERCTLCEGERWLWQRVEGSKSIARERVACPDCHGTGRTEVKRK